jgi:uncharacterized hydrophobic protein (TIGR00271 family)
MPSPSLPAEPAASAEEATDPEASSAPPAEDESAIEEAAREKLGLRRWDRPALYVETAEAATDTDLPFWSVFLLSGAIATLGLALDATAVVIGAMLVAPLLGPLLGLSLALAVGDGRLAVQTSLTVMLGSIGVIALAALLTVLLPFQDVTPEIAARTRPTTVDLGIAVFSGLAGAVVTVSREHRLSASIPGVAIAVALIPPLGVAGFGIGTGWQWPIIRGSMLLFGANFGGIVLSGMVAFLLVGMHREDVVESARRWHREADLPGLSGRISRIRLFSSLRVWASPLMRVGLVLAFIAAVAIPLTSSLRQVLRETRVQNALEEAAAEIQGDGAASVLSRSVSIGEAASRVHFRVATTEWIPEQDRIEIERAASAAAGEPITLVMEQLISSDSDLNSLEDILPPGLTPSPGAPSEASPTATLDRLQTQITGALSRIAFPDGVRPVGAEVAVSGRSVRVLVAYAAPERLPAAAETMIARQTATALGIDPDAVSTEVVRTRPVPLPADSAATATLTDLLTRFPTLRLTIAADSAAVDSMRRVFQRAGLPERQILAEMSSPHRLQLAVAE